MTQRGRTSSPQPATGVVLQDAGGRYYAIPQAELDRFRVADQQRAVVEALLRGADVADVALSVHDSASDEAAGSAALGSGPGSSVWRFRTSRRSDRLWLVFA